MSTMTICLIIFALMVIGFFIKQLPMSFTSMAVLVALVLGEMISPLSLLGGAIVFVTIMVYNVIGARAEQKDTCQGEPV